MQVYPLRTLALREVDHIPLVLCSLALGFVGRDFQRTLLRGPSYNTQYYSLMVSQDRLTKRFLSAAGQNDGVSLGDKHDERCFSLRDEVRC